MKRKISFTALVLILLIILNVMIGGVLVFFIQEIKEPKLDVHFNLTQLTTENLKFTASISTRNDNPYDLVIKNLIIIGRTPKGDIILDVQIKGGSVGANQFRGFTTDGTLAFPGDLSSRIYTSINGVFGVNIAGIFEKTIPFQINITGSFQDLFQNISIPTLSIQAEVTEITENGVLFQGLLRVENPNLFELIIEDMTVRVQTENNDLVGEFSKIEGAIRANNTTEFSLNGSLFYDALNAKVLSLIVTGSAGAHLMGIEKTVLLSTTAQLLIPEIKELLFHNESLGITLSLDAKLRLRGVLTTIGLALYNPSKIPLQANDLLCSIYGLTGENKKIIGQKSMEPSTLGSEQQNFLETDILLPYLKLFTAGTGRFLPDWFVIRIQGNFSITGVNQYIPVAIDATINPWILGL
jgi:LEA14-like dessication related protein